MTSVALPRLSSSTLAQIASGVQLPRDGRENLQTGIVHLGIGAFHRAHQAVFTQDATDLTGDDRWGILGVTQRSRSVVDQLRPQEGLYGVLTAAADGESLRIIGSVKDAAFPAEETARVLATIAAPTTQIVSLTITEKGYCRNARGGVDLDRDDVAGDVASLTRELAGGAGAPSATGIGLLVRGLAARFRAGGERLTVLPCDNLMDNGATTRALVHEFAAAAAGSDAFVAWLAADVTFPGTMVDRIVPATTAAHRARASELSGLSDEGLVVAEPFAQWVIEDDFAGDRPAWEKVGAQFTHDVAIYERTKLRLLNATHSMLAYRGALAGHLTIAEALADPALAQAAQALIAHDLIPSVLPEGYQAPADLDLEAYAASVLSRFANPATGHLTIQVAMDGSQKLPIRLLAAARDRIAAGQTPEQIAGVVGAWIAFVTRRQDVNGLPLVVNDPMLGAIDSALAGDEAGRVQRVLGLSEIFGHDLPENQAFVAAVTAGYQELVG